MLLSVIVITLLFTYPFCFYVYCLFLGIGLFFKFQTSPVFFTIKGCIASTNTTCVLFNCVEKKKDNFLTYYTVYQFTPITFHSFTPF
uniref:Secreted protein n=1 Tax=Pyxicephalus adspersus TaxID=30357 RepID=A0AAV3AIZ8_PYXAD|nr:TPA: hypothetical protein GDO54_009438 [Pyxicephalus adspersus]